MNRQAVIDYMHTLQDCLRAVVTEQRYADAAQITAEIARLQAWLDASA